ncbi:MAG: 1-acyl-sn-glycerol-3-phosphate acyltransferase [Bacteroidota bacterium]
MLYAIVRPFAKIGLSLYFRKIYLTKVDRIPKDKPIILACNHPTAFLEPCILACWLPFGLHFLVRGDVFKRPVFNFVLRALHMLPIYRRRDGDLKSIKNNFSTFDACYEALKKKKVLTMFPEGHTVTEYRLRSLKKGLARIVMGMYEKYPDTEELFIIPIGFSYSAPHSFRSEVKIQVGHPIPTRSLYEMHKEQPNLGVNAILKKLQKALQQQMVIVDHPIKDIVADRLLTLTRSRFPFPALPKTLSIADPLLAEQAIVSQLNQLEQDEVKKLEKTTELYEIALLKHGLKDETLLNGSQSTSRSLLYMILLAVPALLGYLLNYLPVRFTSNTVKTNVKKIEYSGPVFVSTLVVMYMSFSFLSIIIALFFKLWMLLLLVPIMLLTGMAYIHFKAHANFLEQARKLKKVSESRKLELLKMRSDLLSKLVVKN